ncbi:MAG: hypothetical protein F6K35_49750 [Okeania sp. SIO2H7]|nr:hypothetical protein [Okeania sp. SIO2H7]
MECPQKNEAEGRSLSTSRRAIAFSNNYATLNTANIFIKSIHHETANLL